MQQGKSNRCIIIQKADPTPIEVERLFEHETMNLGARRVADEVFRGTECHRQQS